MLGFLAGLPGRIKTLTDRLTSARATAIDNLDATMSSRASASSLSTLAGNVSTILGRTDVATSTRMGGIKQIIQGSVSWNSAGASWTNFSLSPYSLNYAKTILIPEGMVFSSTGGLGTALILNSGAQRVDGAGGGITGNQPVMYFMVVEFY